MAAKFAAVFRVMATNVPHSAESMRAFRSKLVAFTFAFGPFTALTTYNPSEMQSLEHMQLCGYRYGFTPQGWPDTNRPDRGTRYSIVAGHPVACAMAFFAFREGMRTVLYGWPSGEAQQVNPDCLFGQVTGSNIAVAHAHRCCACDYKACASHKTCH